MIHANWDRRIRRATELTSSFPFAAEGLRFYGRVATFQRSLYAEIQKALADSPKISSARPLRDELDLFLLLPNFPGFLSVIQRIAPAPLAQAAAALAQKGPAGWQRRSRISGTRISESAADGATRKKRGPAIRTRQVLAIDCSRGFIFNRTPSILPIAARTQSWMELLRLARCAEASRSWASCGVKATGRRNL
jgi:hypothetical protein